MDRFWSKVRKTSGCWFWMAYRDEKGYGRFGYHGKQSSAHRVSYELTYGPIPAGGHVLHSCDNPACVKPTHLRVGSHADNMRDRTAHGRNPFANKTHCKHGHPYDEENTYWRPNGGRGCKTCRTEAKRAYRARKIEAA